MASFRGNYDNLGLTYNDLLIAEEFENLSSSSRMKLHGYKLVDLLILF